MGMDDFRRKVLQELVQSPGENPEGGSQVEALYSIVGEGEMAHGVNFHTVLVPAMNRAGKSFPVPVPLSDGIGHDDPNPVAQSCVGRCLGVDERGTELRVEAGVADDQYVHTSNLPVKSMLAAFFSGSFTGFPVAAD